MAGTKEIKDRIKSVKDTQKITNAMYLIASTKLRHARKSQEDNEPYFYTAQDMMARIGRHLPQEAFSHRYLCESVKPETERVHGFLVVTADKGLAGAYNQNVLRMTEELMRGRKNVMLFVVGEVGRKYFEKQGVRIDRHFLYTAQNPTRHRSRIITMHLLDLFDSGELSDVTIVYTAMKNRLEVEARHEQLLPMAWRLPSVPVPGNVLQEEFLLHPSPEAVLESVIPNYINGYIYSALIESYCAEQNSRMIAMQTANDSANEILHDLGIQYNRERQAAITQEITEVSTGARAMRGKE